MSGHGWCATAFAKNHALILEVQVANQGFVMGFEGIERPVVTVPGNREESGLQVFVLQGSVERAEAVDKGFQLGGHSVVVKWRDENNQIGIKDCRSDDFHIVFLSAGTIIAAIEASAAGMDLAMRGREDSDFMTGFSGSPDKFFRKHVGGAIAVGASFENNDFH